MFPDKIKRVYWYVELIPKLGIWDVIYVAFYRVLLKSGILVKKFPVTKLEKIDPIFTKRPILEDFPPEWKENLLVQADEIVSGNLPYFSYHRLKQSTPPNWFLNPFNDKEYPENQKHWTKLSDFNNELGDIKNVWETSRFSWVGILARAYTVSGKEVYLNTINEWLSDWIKKNPANQGPNWKCGQEASIRVINLLNAAQILNQTESPTDTLITVIRLHLQRILPNIRYALAQRNNHGTSEASAMFIGGSWLAKVDNSNRTLYLDYADKGRNILERLIQNLVYEDGSFAQHSVNYHRLFLDTITFVAFWTQKLSLKAFPSEYIEKAKKSVDWLLNMIDESGNCPNFGANDGTMLQGNHSCDYCNFKPSLQIASTLIKKQIVFNNGPWNETLYWFNIKKDCLVEVPFLKKSKLYCSGYVIMNAGNSWALLHFPYYKFRPAHNDVFHFDLWADGNNLLFDSGSYSYNPDLDSKVPDLKSVHSHNTLSFDHEEQMPRLGRFLLGKWIKPFFVGDLKSLEVASGMWEGSYKDAKGNLHHRKVIWGSNKWEIHDQFRGKAKNIEIGFNFDSCDYSIETKTNTLLLPWGKILVSENAGLQVVHHMISKYYLHSANVNRLVISSENNSAIVTSIFIS